MMFPFCSQVCKALVVKEKYRFFSMSKPVSDGSFGHFLSCCSMQGRFEPRGEFVQKTVETGSIRRNTRMSMRPSVD